MPHTQHTKHLSLRVRQEASALLKADAELRIEGSSYRSRSTCTRTAVHRTSARLPLYVRPSESVNQLPPFIPRIRSATQFGPLRTLHQGQRGDRRGPLRATADWRGTDSDLDRATARCSAHQTDSMTGNGRPSTLRKPPTTPAAKYPMVSLSLVLVVMGLVNRLPCAVTTTQHACS